MSDETKRLDIEAIEARAQRVYPAEGWSHEDAAHRARWVVRDDVPALVAEVRWLREIIEGRIVCPTAAEIAVHRVAGGSWEVRGYDDDTRRYWPRDRDGKPCAWPVPA